MQDNSSRKCRCCGNSLGTDSDVCSLCNTQQRGGSFADDGGQSVHIDSLKSRYVAAILAILFGSFGAHRFYFRRYVSAALYVIFWWTPVVSILANIEAILIVQSSQKTLYNYLIKNSSIKLDEAQNPFANVLIIIVAAINILRTSIFSLFMLLPLFSIYNENLPWQIYDIFRYVKEFLEYHIY